MTKPKIQLATVVIAVSLFAPLGSAEEPELVVLRNWGGSNYVDYFKLFPAKVEQLPKWSPQTGNSPPVSISKVVPHVLPLIRKAANGWPWRIKTIGLVKGQSEGKENVWFYDVHATVETQIKGKRKPVTLHLLTFMDGTVLFPEVEILINPGPPAPDPVVRPDPRFDKARTIVLSRVGLQSGEDYVYEISKEAALSLPNWYAESSKPVPLDAGRALSHLHALIDKHIPQQEWDLVSFRLVCGGKGGGKPFAARHISYYSIAIRHRPKGSKQEKKYWNILILLDESGIFPDPLPFVD